MRPIVGFGLRGWTVLISTGLYAGSLIHGATAPSRFIVSAEGLAVQDTVLHATWLALGGGGFARLSPRQPQLDSNCC